MSEQDEVKELRDKITSLEGNIRGLIVITDLYFDPVVIPKRDGGVTRAKEILKQLDTESKCLLEGEYREGFSHVIEPFRNKLENIRREGDR